MVLGALVDAGLSLDVIRDTLDAMDVRGVSLNESRAQRGGVTGTLLTVDLDESAMDTRRFDDFIATVQASRLSNRVKSRSTAVFERMAAAEARVHRADPGELHLHELGTLDTLVDVVGTVAGLEALGVENVFSSPLPMGSGVFRSAHGVLPVPSPAAAQLFAMADAPLVPAPGGAARTGEMVTPTGAGIITTLAEFRQPKMSVASMGYGVGSRDPEEYPNVLALWVGEVDEAAPVGGLSLIETNIDDSTGEMLGFVQERLLEIGARDVWFTPIQMKKNRPATMLSAIVSERGVDRAVELVLRETTTLGVRVRPITRYEADREIRKIETSLGPVAIKVKTLDGVAVAVSPEYEDCRRLALQLGLPLQQVFRIVGREAEDAVGVAGLPG